MKSLTQVAADLTRGAANVAIRLVARVGNYRIERYERRLEADALNRCSQPDQKDEDDADE